MEEKTQLVKRLLATRLITVEEAATLLEGTKETVTNNHYHYYHYNTPTWQTWPTYVTASPWMPANTGTNTATITGPFSVAAGSSITFTGGKSTTGQLNLFSNEGK